MPRLTPVDFATATDDQKEVLKRVGGENAAIMFQLLGNSPAALGVYADYSAQMRKASILRKLREQIALATAQYNQCQYCLSAHVAGSQKLGLTEDEILAARRFQAADPRHQAALTYTHALLEKRGGISDADFEALKGAGFTDAEISEITVAVIQNIFTNYFNISMQTPLEDPAVDLVLPPA